MDTASDGETPSRPARMPKSAQSDDELSHMRRSRLKTLQPRHAGLWRASSKKRQVSKKESAGRERVPRHRRVYDNSAPVSTRLPIACKCTSDSYDLQSLFTYYTTAGMKPQIFDDVVHIEFGVLAGPHVNLDGSEDTKTASCAPSWSLSAATAGEKAFDAFFFPFGVFVCWGVSEKEIEALQEELLEFEVKPLDPEDVYAEEFDFRYDSKIYIDRLKDEIVLNDEFSRSDDIDAKCAISHGLSLCVKLSVFEAEIEKTIQGTKHLPEELALDGSIHMSDQDISKIIGEIFIQRNSVNLHLDVLDMPDFFWERPELEPLYKLTRSYLDLNKRVDILNRRLDVLKELLEILKDQLNTQHASKLEWIVIWLIVLELCISLIWNILIKGILHWV